MIHPAISEALAKSRQQDRRRRAEQQRLARVARSRADHGRRAGVSSFWRALRQTARALREFHAEQVHYWERYYQACRVQVPHDGPLAWVLTLDGYRLAGSRLPAPVHRATGDRPA
jgi:hypothetical protein